MVVNGASLAGAMPAQPYSPLQASLWAGEANVLRVFLENGQTKTIRYDSATTVQVSVSPKHGSRLTLSHPPQPPPPPGCGQLANGETVHQVSLLLRLGL